MNRSDIIVRLAEQAGISQPLAEKVLQTITDAMTSYLKEGGRIEIRGFGSFAVKQYDGYTGRNPKTGEQIKVGQKKLPFFKPGKELKERVDSYHPNRGGLGKGIESSAELAVTEVVQSETSPTEIE